MTARTTMQVMALQLPMKAARAACFNCLFRPQTIPRCIESIHQTRRSIQTAPNPQGPDRPQIPSSLDAFGASLSSRTASLAKKPATLQTHKLPRAHRLHIYATRHNTHLTLTTAARNVILSMSCGQLDFRKGRRGTYDAAYQLAVYMFSQIQNRGLFAQGCDPRYGPIQGLEVVMRDSGPGKEAVLKVLMGAEGAALRSRTVRVMEATRLKFGGTRSPKPRRLG